MCRSPVGVVRMPERRMGDWDGERAVEVGIVTALGMGGPGCGVSTAGNATP